MSSAVTGVRNRVSEIAVAALVAAPAGAAVGALINFGLSNGLARSDYVSLIGNFFSVLAAVALAIWVEQRQREARTREMRAFLNEKIAHIEDVARRWSEIVLPARQDPNPYVLPAHAFYVEFDDAIAALLPARQLFSADNMTELSRAHRILAAWERSEYFRDAVPRSQANNDSQILNLSHHIMGWSYENSLATLLGARV